MAIVALTSMIFRSFAVLARLGTSVRRCLCLFALIFCAGFLAVTAHGQPAPADPALDPSGAIIRGTPLPDGVVPEIVTPEATAPEVRVPASSAAEGEAKGLDRDEAVNAPNADGSETDDPRAAGTTDGTGKLPTADLKALVELLENEAARTAFVDSLKDLIAARGEVVEAPPSDPAASFLAEISAQIKAASTLIVDAIALIAETENTVTELIEQPPDAETVSTWAERLTNLGVIISVAVAVFVVSRLILRRPLAALRGQRSDRLVYRILLLVTIAALEALPIALFAISAYATVPIVEPSFLIRRVALVLVDGHIIAQALLVAVRFALAHQSPGLRILPIGDDAAGVLTRISFQVITIGVYGFYMLQALYALFLPTEFYILLLRALGFFIVVRLLFAIVLNRAYVAAWLRGSDTAEKDSLWKMLRRRLAGVWHVLAVIYVIGLYVVWLSGLEGALAFIVRGTILSILVLLLSSVISVSIGRAIIGFITGHEGGGGRRYLNVVRRVVDILVYAFAALVILEVWGVDSFEWLRSDQGQRIVGSAATVLLVIVATIALSESLGALIERYLSETTPAGEPVQTSARARTLLPLARKALLGLLIVLAAFIILSELGVDIAPLIAGAGVVGIAVGFGAQSLVKDVISGFFILLEDTLSIGDVVDIDGNGGLVEAISIRTVVLRDLSGTVHTIPFGTVNRIQNLTKEFSYYLMDIRIAYREDVDEVIEVIKSLGQELYEDPRFGPLIIAPIEVLGVDQFADSAVVIKARIKTRPIQQWAVGREYNRRLKKKFDELGIEIPFPHQTIYFGADPQGQAAPAHIELAAGGSRPASQSAVVLMRADTEAPVRGE